MKKTSHIIFLGIVFIICLGITACGKKGGTLEFNNDRNFTVWITFDINGKEILYQYELLPGQKKNYSDSEDFNYSYSVRDKPINQWATPLSGYGNITGGDTIVIWMSGIYK